MENVILRFRRRTTGFLPPFPSRRCLSIYLERSKISGPPRKGEGGYKVYLEALITILSCKTIELEPLVDQSASEEGSLEKNGTASPSQKSQKPTSNSRSALALVAKPASSDTVDVLKRKHESPLLNTFQQNWNADDMQPSQKLSGSMASR
ncbi:hypothetical protein BDZ45DRAFT_694091 [Acephala macrosclerotiorum]|nr:hypothetical protein BDZ45DRAFT_694091 [Acephala macrosclerotiorum]